MLIRSIGIFFLMILLSSNSWSQKDIDSLVNLLNKQTNEIAKMQIMLELGDKYQSSSKEKALVWYQKIIPSALIHTDSVDTWFNNSPEGSRYFVTVALARSGIILSEKNSVDEAIANLQLSNRFAIKMNQLPLAVYSSDNLAVIFARNKRFEEASDYFDKSFETYRELNDTNGMVYCLGNLGIINANLGNLYKAADYYERLFDLQESINSPSETLDDLLNIATIYTRLEEYAKAKKYWERASSLTEQLNSIEKERLVYANLGITATKLDQNDEALKFYHQLYESSLKDPKDQNSEVMALNNMAILSSNLGNVDQSINYWERTYELAKTKGYAQYMLDALINLSSLYSQLNNLEESSSYFEKYLSLSEQVGNLETIANSYIGIGELQVKLGKFDKAREYLGKALDVYSKANDINGLGKVNLLIASTYQKQENYYNALDFYNANIDIIDSLDKKNQAATYQGKAENLRLQMQYEQAIILFQKALSLWADLDNNPQVSVCYNSLGLIHEVTGNLPNAVANYENALSIADESGNREAIAAVSNNLGVVYRQLGDLSKALESYQRALTFYLELNNNEGASYSYNNMGIIYENQKDYVKANELYEKSLAIKEESQDKKGLATSLMNMGNVYKFIGNHQKAEETYNRALEISTQINDEQGKALAYGSLAALKLETADYQTAIELSKKSLEIAKAIDLKSAVREAQRQLGWAYNATLQPNLAEEEYLQVIEMNYDDINRNFSILSESEKEMFFSTVAQDFDRFHSFALRRMETNPSITQKVYNNLLRNKGLLLKSSTAMRNAIFTSNNKELIQNYEQWIKLKQDIAKLYTLPVEQRDADIVALEKQANDLERILVKSSNEFSDFERSFRFDWNEVKNLLSENEAAIEFLHFKDSQDSIVYCALVLTKDMANPAMIKLFEEKELERILGNFMGNNLNYINGVYGTRSISNPDLYNLIWNPIVNLISHVKTIYFSPSGLLHKISFAALSDDQNSFLIDDHKMHLVSTSANIGTDSKIEIQNNSSVTLFGGISYSTKPSDSEAWGYLSGTLDETKIISGLLEQQLEHVTTFSDTMASETRFKEVSPETQILHIATHGFFFPDPQKVKQQIEEATEYGDVEFRGASPTFGMDNFVRSLNPLMRSGLVFAGVNDYWNGTKHVVDDDGVLTALEVINIDLRKNNLVVMSACETGLGEIAGSEGVYGLQRAFKMAGTKYLIMSLWQVPDKETSEFMQIFYSELVKTSNLHDSFTFAQTVMRSKYDPYFWAAFVLLE